MYLEALLGANNGGGSSKTFNTDDFNVVANEVSLTPAQRTFTGTTAEWEALTAEEKALYGTVQLTDDGDANYKDVYSTSEVKTNKVWIDGKPIYRKVLEVDSLPNNSSKYIDTGVSNLGQMVYMSAIVQSSTSVCILNHIAFSDGGFPNQYCMAFNYARGGEHDNQIKIDARVDRSAWSGYITIEYTKTTD